jgi:zinc protease
MKLRSLLFVSPLAPVWLLTGVLGTLPSSAFARERPSVRQEAAAIPQGVEKVTSVEGITEYKLANGLRVLLFPDPSKQTMTVNVTYLVGSRNENYGETGMAHLLEHLMFKGSTRHLRVWEEMNQYGAQFNGSTFYDRTNYFETFPATDTNLDWAIDMEADRMVHSFIAKKDLDSEMTVVRNEFEAGENSPVEILMQRVLATAYLWHNYGKLTIGARSDIENVPIERLQAFWRTYYQPDNAVLLVAGKFDPDKALALVNAKFGPIPRPTRTIQPTYTVEPPQDGERSVTLRRVGDVAVAETVYHVPAGSHPDYAAIDILTQMFGDEPSGRLYKELVLPKKAASVFAFGFQLKEPGVAFFGATVRKENSLDEARDILTKTVEGAATTPPTLEEVERARQQLLKQMELNLNSSDQVGVQLSEWIAIGDWRMMFLHRDRLKKVTLDDVKRVAAQYFAPNNRTVGLFIPTLKPQVAEIPTTPDVVALLKDYKGGAAVANGEAFDPSPGNIETRTTHSAQPGGLKLALLPKKTRGGSVQFSMGLHFGDVKSVTNRRGAAQMAGEMLMRGTSKHTRQQIQDEFDKLKARVYVGGSTTDAWASIDTTRENLPAAMKLVAEILREPSFPQAEFDTLKQQRLAGYEEQKTQPDAILFNELSRHLNPYPKGDPRYTRTIEESIAEVQATKLEDAKQFYRDFYGASVGEIAVVGDFDDKAIAKLAGDLFNDWKSPRPYARLTSDYADVPAINSIFETPDKSNAMLGAGLNLKIRDDNPDYPALAMANYILGGNPASRLFNRLRQKDGLSYGVGSMLQANALDESGMFMVYAICAPENADKAIVGFKEELVKALKDGFTPEEVARAKAGMLQQRHVSRADDGGLAGTLSSYSHINRTLQYDAEFERYIQALTPEEIVTTMRKYIDPAKVTVMKAGDFAGAAKKKATTPETKEK